MTTTQGTESLLKQVFGTDFKHFSDPGAFTKRFFEHQITLEDLAAAHEFLSEQSIGDIESAARIGNPDSEKTFGLLTMIHGNEPAGLAGCLLSMALEQAGLLDGQVIAVIGNHQSANEFFEHFKNNKDTSFKDRIKFRKYEGQDFNRVPADFDENYDEVISAYRAKQLVTLLNEINAGFLDVHTARNSVQSINITSKQVNDKNLGNYLINSPINNIVSGLLEGMSRHSPDDIITVKQIVEERGINPVIGIEAGQHEEVDSFTRAAEFTLNLLYNLELTRATPHYQDRPMDQEVFDHYKFTGPIKISNLEGNKIFPQDDEAVFPVKKIDDVLQISDDSLVLAIDDEGKFHTSLAGKVEDKNSIKFKVHQFDELEEIKQGQELIVSIPSGQTLKAAHDGHVIFPLKSWLEYPEDTSSVRWPIPPKRAQNTWLGLGLKKEEITLTRNRQSSIGNER